MEPQFELHWYPGHMAKARRELQSRWKLADVLLEVVDARAPATSRHPEPVPGWGGRPRVLLLAKADLADRRGTGAWLRHFQRAGVPAFAADLRQGGWVQPVRRMLRSSGRGRRARGEAVRVVVAGLPNVGKSTAINGLVGRAKAQTGGAPGVTRGLQWLGAGSGLQLLDSPGVLWPEATRGLPALVLAATGCVPDAVFDAEKAADGLLRLLLKRFPGAVESRYGDGLTADAAHLLADVARRRGMLRAGAEPDTERAAAIVLLDFRTGRFGPVTLERPPEGDGDDDGGRPSENR